LRVRKDFRRIATRYDKLARNFLASVAIAATTIWWTQLSLDPLDQRPAFRGG
jgi:hypothetical protein